ncbi:MAG TPA: nuclear transport factor 2 family protein [Caulobacteraceae bacterium]|nr:nuclear transport factor 2 family protein [Caulobacteraceae bacterium]
MTDAGFRALLDAFAAAAVAGDGQRFAALFTEDGCYHDVFYGAFRGREAIADMIENRFHRDAENFRWDLHDPVRDGGVAYARYVFSYDSKLAGSQGKRALFEGVGIFRLDGDLIRDYREVANAAPGLLALGFAPERVAKFLAREARELAGRAEAQGHVR